ncbi:MAG TPA: hypothetical protein VHE81_05410 [Lacipirellulaceae bacterium]|nr:hypothetical protein [Lacipirellulaceae bacterium]
MSNYRMFMGSTAVARAIQAGADFAELSAKAGEMIVAANAVIGERVAMMVEAARDPRTANYIEFARMLPEKVTAMQQAGSALLDECWSVRGDIGDYMTYVARMMTGNWPPSPCDVAELMEQTSVYGTRMAAAAIDVVSVMLVPFHGCATSNACDYRIGSERSNDSEHASLIQGLSPSYRSVDDLIFDPDADLRPIRNSRSSLDRFFDGVMDSISSFGNTGQRVTVSALSDPAIGDESLTVVPPEPAARLRR